MILVPSGYGLTPRRDHPRCRWRISTLRHFALDEQRFALHIGAVSGYTGGSTTAREGETAGGLPEQGNEDEHREIHRQRSEVERRRAFHEGHAAISAVRFFRS